MTIYGYCRISTPNQSIDRQVRNILRAYPSCKIYQEVYTGTTKNRIEWQKLKKRVKPGDTIVFDSVSRMSRNAEEGFEDYQTLYDQDISLVFLKEPHINTTVYRQAREKKLTMTGTPVDHILHGINEYLLEIARLQIRLAFERSEAEVMDLRQRTKEGMLTARLNGKQIGRPGGRTYETTKARDKKRLILAMSKDFGGTMKDKDIIELLGINRKTYYKYKKQLTESIIDKYDTTSTKID